MSLNDRMKRDIEKAFDDCIKSMGGNLDSRANNDKLRKSLAKFYHDVTCSNRDFYSDITMRVVLKRMLE